MVFECLAIHDLLNLWLACSQVSDFFLAGFGKSRFKYGMEFRLSLRGFTVVARTAY